MELSDLDQDERIALVGLLKLVVMSERNVSDEEADHLHHVVDALGEDSYRHALDSVEQRFPDLDSFRKFLPRIERQEARDLIFGTLLEAAGAEAVEGQESELLDWLAQLWNVKIEIADEVPGEG